MNAELHPAIHQWKHHTLSLSAKIFNQSFSCLAGSIHRVSHLTPSPGPCFSASHSKDGEHRRLHHRFFRNTLSKAPVLYIGLCMLNLRAENNCRHSRVFLGLWEACKHLGIHYLNTWTSSVLEELELELQSTTVEYFTKLAALS